MDLDTRKCHLFLDTAIYRLLFENSNRDCVFLKTKEGRNAYKYSRHNLNKSIFTDI